MSLLDKVKGTTGLGLTPDEAYHRAYEKGVHLGKYEIASDMFAKAAQKFEETGQTEKAHRARANQFLYSYIVRKDPAVIDTILTHLGTVKEIEALGSDSDRIPVRELVTELQARKLEGSAFGASSNPQEALELHRKAADLFQNIIKARLKTYKMVPEDDHNDSAEERYFLHLGHATFYEAVLSQDADPTRATEKVNEAALAFRRAKDEQLRAQMEKIQSDLRVSRTCWFCHREMQGLGLNVDYYPAKVTRYEADLIAKLGQDMTTVDHDAQAVAVCLSCATMVRNQADDIARALVEELRSELQSQLNEIVRELDEVAKRLKHLERLRR